ncbi:MAG: argininosuccinate lyase [Candidatus Adiutricales bacterium]
MTEKGRQKSWGGRFSKATDDLLESFSASVHFDHKLYAHDIAGSQAHAKMLGRQGLVSKDESDQIIQGLEEIKKEIEAGEFDWDPKLEDVHMNIEQALVKKIGPAGEKLHTGRSRNDQVALDTRLYLKDAIDLLADQIKELRLAIVSTGVSNQGLLMPGYTHLQRAQPVLLAHHLLAYNEMFKRDGQRLADLYPRVDVMPLGSAALAGTGLPIDPEFVAKELGFNQIVANSMDGVSDRDYLIEFLAASSILMMHLSRLSEELILWSTAEFGFVELPDDLTTGSSIMPQKKNPDICELIRGKTGRIYGNLMALLTVMKGMPLAYNRDFQEDKEPLFDTVETLTSALPLMTRLVSNLDFKAEKMLDAADDPVVTATDLADYLVKQGVPFRLAHEQVGLLVKHCLDNDMSLLDIDESEMARFCPDVKPGVKEVLTISASVEARISPGGTAPGNVQAALDQALKELKK